MRTIEHPRFSDEAHKVVYRYVERQGSVDAQVARVHLDMPHERFHDVLSDLKREGYLAERDGSLRLAIDAGDESRHGTNGFEYIVRPGRQEDLPGLLKVVAHVADRDGYVVAEGVAAALRYEDAVTRHSHARSRVFFVAVDEGNVVGWTHLETSPAEPLRHTARQTVGVLEPYRGYGIGGALLEHGLDWAEDAGYLKVYNSLPSTSEHAMQFLEAHGWETEAIRRDHFAIDGEFVDEVMMAAYPGDSRLSFTDPSLG